MPIVNKTTLKTRPKHLKSKQEWVVMTMSFVVMTRTLLQHLKQEWHQQQAGVVVLIDFACCSQGPKQLKR